MSFRQDEQIETLENLELSEVIHAKNTKPGFITAYKRLTPPTLFLALFLITLSILQLSQFLILSKRIAHIELIEEHLLQKEQEFENKINDLKEVIQIPLSSLNTVFPPNEIIIPLDEKSELKDLR